jgi:hypothetical protein
MLLMAESLRLPRWVSALKKEVPSMANSATTKKRRSNWEAGAGIEPAIGTMRPAARGWDDFDCREALRFLSGVTRKFHHLSSFVLPHSVQEA